MDSTFKCTAVASKKIIGRHDMESIMNMTFYIGENGSIQFCFGDTTEMKDHIIEPQKITDETYPNEGSIARNRNDLWLSMFTRIIEYSSLVEVEEEIKEE